MMPSLAASLLALSCALVLAPAPGPRADDLFPVVTGKLVLEVSGEGAGPSVLDVARRYAELTGQTLVWTDETEAQLRHARIGLDRAVAVPGGELQLFFEHLLRANDFALQLVTRAEPRVVEVVSLQTQRRNTIRAGAMAIAASETALAGRHPALLFSTQLELPHLDVRQVSNSMRTLVTDANTTQLLPAGNASTMVLVGFGDWVAGTAAALRQMDAAASQQMEAAASARREARLLVLPVVHADAGALVAVVTEAMTNYTAVAANRPAPEVAAGPARCLVSCDPRTNALVVACAPELAPTVEQLVAALDLAVPAGTK